MEPFEKPTTDCSIFIKSEKKGYIAFKGYKHELVLRNYKLACSYVRAILKSAPLEYKD